MSQLHFCGCILHEVGCHETGSFDSAQTRTTFLSMGSQANPERIVDIGSLTEWMILMIGKSSVSSAVLELKTTNTFLSIPKFSDTLH